MKVLIFYASYGGGHYTAANSIKEYLEEQCVISKKNAEKKQQEKIGNNKKYENLRKEEQEIIIKQNNNAEKCKAKEQLIKESPYNNLEIKMVDCMKYINLNLEKVTTNAYKSVTKNAPKAWEAIYRISDKEPVLSISNFGNKIMSQKLNKLIQEFNPDVVISTHPFSTQMIAYLKHKKKTNCLLASIMTDYVPQNQWLIGHEYIDFIFVATEEMKKMIVDLGVDEHKIYATGIPISSKFFKKYSKEEVTKEFNLDEQKDILLFFGGGEYGLTQKTTSDILRAFINNLKNKYQMIVISGKNEEIRKKFESIAEKLNSTDKVKVIGFSNEIPKLMNVSTLAITKPGGLTTTECINSCLPMIIINPIPGQEEDNAKFIEKNGAGIWIKTNKIKEMFIKEMQKTDINITFKLYECIEEQVKNILDNPEKFEQMRKNANRIAKKSSTRDICNIIFSKI